MMTLPLTHPATLLAGLILAMAIAFVAVGRIHRILPQGGRLERWAFQWAVTAQALIVALGSLTAVYLVYRGDPFAWRSLTLAVFLAALWSLRHALSDYGSGLVLRAEGTLRMGERVGAGTARGRIVGLGLRSAEVEAEDDGVLRIPYSALATTSIETSSADAVTRSVTFGIDVPKDSDPGGLIQELANRALLSPWSSAQRVPSVRVVQGDQERMRIEVTVFPVDPVDAAKIEAAVRDGL